MKKVLRKSNLVAGILILAESQIWVPPQGVRRKASPP